jgi:hypothetical protein
MDTGGEACLQFCKTNPLPKRPYPSGMLQNALMKLAISPELSPSGHGLCAGGHGRRLELLLTFAVPGR